MIVLGRIGAPFGVSGFVHIRSFTEEIDSLLDYQPWYLNTKTGWQPVEVLEERSHGHQGFVVRLEGCQDRDAAARLTNLEIGVLKSSLPTLEEGHYYWTDLVGLKVVNEQDKELGRVSYLFETGSNDVLVVLGEKQGKPQEYLIPYIPETYILNVDITAQEIKVHWDPEF